MSPILAGIDTNIERVFRENNFTGLGQSPKSIRYCNALNGLLERDRQAATRLVTDVLSSTYSMILNNVRRAVANGQGGPSEQRGRLRAEVTISVEAQSAIRNMSNLERPLERTIVFLMNRNDDNKYEWFNEFNVASGFCERNDGRRLNVDIVRRLKKEPLCWDLVELKEWDGDTPLSAAFQVYRYFCICFIMKKLGLDNCNPNWMEMLLRLTPVGQFHQGQRCPLG